MNSRRCEPFGNARKSDGASGRTKYCKLNSRKVASPEWVGIFILVAHCGQENALLHLLNAMPDREVAFGLSITVNVDR
jgi:hypothetical protein